MDVLAQALPWTEIGWGAVVVLVVILILRGYLVPRIFYQEVVRDRDRWRTMAEELREENSKLLVIGELGVNSIYAIEKVVEDKIEARANKVKQRPEGNSS